MNNFDIAKNALNTSLNSSGSAMEEHEKAMQSIELKLNSLKVAWQGFAQTFMDSDLLKGGIDALRVFVEILEKLVDSLGSFGAIGLGAGIFGLFKNFSTLKTLGKDVFTVLTTNAMDSYDAFTKWNKASNGIVSSGKALVSSMSAVVGGIGILVAGIGLAINIYKNAKEEASKARQEVIQSSSDFLEASNSFEQAYIKYSGKTNLTAEEEAELESAIDGTVDALGDKSDALQNVVNSSNDYVASLERITDAELKAAERAAKEKQKNAKLELEESIKDWYSNNTAKINIKNDSDALKIAKEMDSEFFKKKSSSVGKGNPVATYWFDMPSNADADTILNYYYELEEYKNKLLAVDDFDTNKDIQSAYEDVNTTIEQLSKTVKVYESGLYDLAKAEYEAANGIPKTTEAYLDMREAILAREDIAKTNFDTRKSILNSLDSQYGSVFDLSSAKAQARKFIGIINGYDDDEAGKVETFLNMRTAVNNNEVTVGKYLSELENIGTITDGWTDKEKEEFNLSFGIDADSVKEQYDELEKYLLRQIDTSGMTGSDIRMYKEVESEKIREFLNGLTANEVSAFLNIKTEIDWDNTPLDNIKKQIEEEAAHIEAISFDIDITNVAESLDKLSTAMSESVSGTGLASESISAIEEMFGTLDGYDPSKLFERTANGIRLNTTELSKLSSEYKSTNIDGLDDKMSALGERYLQTREELSDLTYGTDEYNQKIGELSAIEEQINATETLIAQYKGLTNAYQEWQRAESAGSQRDMYEGIIEGWENVGDEISRGWLDDGSIEFLKLLYGDKTTITKIVDGKKVKKEIDIATASAADLKQAYEELDNTIKHTAEGGNKGYSISDFFTVDEDGNSTSQGVYNFLDAIGHMEEEVFGGKDVVQRKDGKIIGFDFQIVGGNEAIAEALGISEELVDIMVRAADDAGFVISMDGTYQQLDVLKEKAQEAANKLKETFKVTNYEFDLNTSKATGEGSIAEQYEKASNIWKEFKKNKNKDGTVNMDVEGAEEAFTLVSTLQSMIDKVSEPVYMELDVSQVEKDIQEPLDKLKQYESLAQQEHQLQLKGTDTSEIDKAQKEILDYFDGLDKETKIKLGIEGLTKEEIESKIEKGEIQIPATVDIQMDMSDDIKDMKLLMMNELGLVSDEEVKLKVGYEIDDTLVDTLDDEEKEVVIKFISKNEKWFNSLSEEEKEVTIEIIAENKEWYDKLDDKEKEIVVSLVSSGIDIETLTNDETKKVVVDFVEKNGDLFNKLDDEEKQIFIKYIEENKDTWESLSKDDKEIFVELIASGIDLETLTNKETKEVVIDFVAENDKEFEKLNDEEKEVVVDLVTDDSALEALEKHKVEIEAFARIFGVEEVDDLKERLEGLDEKQILVVAEVIGKIDVDKLKAAMNSLEDEDVKAIAKAIGKGDVESLRDAIFNLEDKEIEAIAKAFGYKDVDSLKKAMDNLTDKDVQAIAKTLGITDVDSLKEAIDRLKDKDVEAVAKVDGEDDVNSLKSSIDNLKGKNVTVWASIKKKASDLWDKLTGTGEVNGTARVGGTAFANGTSGRAFKQGDWRTKKTETALTGELGREIVVTPNNQWYTVGDSGAEFVNIPRGSIVFNHKQTEELLANGKVTSGGGRGKALVSGTALSKGTGGGLEPEVKSYSVGTDSSSKKSSSSSSSTSSDDDDFEETFDWVEIAISRIERAIDNLDSKANNVYKSWSYRNKALSSEIEKVGDEIAIQEEAYDEYMSAANDVGLSEKYASKVRDGTIDIETITDEDLADKIDEYQQW